MGKFDIHLHLSDGVEQARRRGQGFPDFWRPFSAPNTLWPAVLRALLTTAAQDLFLCKSADEWLELWMRFVAMVEAQIVRPNYISVVLYTSHAMGGFCSEKQRFSAAMHNV